MAAYLVLSSGACGLISLSGDCLSLGTPVRACRAQIELHGRIELGPSDRVSSIAGSSWIEPSRIELGSFKSCVFRSTLLPVLANLMF